MTESGDGETSNAAHGLFLLLLLANLVYLTLVGIGSSPSVAQSVAVATGCALLAGIWTLVARGARFPAGADLVCAGALMLVSYGLPSIDEGTTLVGVSLIYRGTFGGDAFSRRDQLSGMPYRAAILCVAGYVSGPLFAQGHPPRMLAHLVFLTPVAVSATVIGRVLARNGAARDRALQRELHLSEAIRALSSATDPSALYQIVVRAALRLLGSIDGARVTLMAPDADGYSTVVAGGSASGVTRRLHADVLPASLEAALQRGAAHWLTAEELQQLAEATHVSALHPFALMLPLRTGGRGPSLLFAAFPTRPASEFVNALGVLAADAASELQSVALSSQLAYQAQHDVLTGLANRALFQDRLEQAVARRADNVHTGLAVLFLDLNDFKTVNDTFGHEAGDEVLKAVAVRLASCRRSSDVVGRLGGDEFAVVLEPVADEAEARTVAQRIRDAVSHPVPIFTGQAPCTASVGVARWIPGLSAGQLLAQADTAMYLAKEHKDGVATYNAELASDAVERAALRTALEYAVVHGQLEVHYQPVFTTTDLTLASFEALARWRHPSRGLLMPDSFIPFAERSGLIVELGRRVLRSACEQLRDWRQQHPAVSEMTMAVNVSVRELEEPDYAEAVISTLAAADLAPDRLVLEVTESLLMAHGHPGIAQLGQLHRLGVRIAIDDFGTGFSALSRLRSFPASHLKLDRSFVADIQTDPFAAALAKAILAMSHSLGLNVVAEGVETPEQLDWLQTHTCQQVQGYLLSAPAPAVELEELLNAGRPQHLAWIRG